MSSRNRWSFPREIVSRLLKSHLVTGDRRHLEPDPSVHNFLLASLTGKFGADNDLETQTDLRETRDSNLFVW